MTSRQDTPRPRRRRIKASHIIISLLVLIIASLFVVRLRSKSTLEARLDALRAAGYPTTPAELDRWYTIPDTADNAADKLIEAFSYYDNSDEERMEQMPVVGSGKLPDPAEPFAQEMKDLIANYLSDNQKALDLLHQAAAIEHSRYPIDLTDGFNVLMPELGDLRQGARLLQLQAVLHAANAESHLAVDSMATIFGIARSLDREPLLISQLVRISINRLGVSTLEQVLNRVELSESQLADMAQLLRATEDNDGFALGFVGERCIGVDLMQNLDWKGVSGAGGPALPRPIIGLYKATGLADIQAVRYLDHMTGYVEALQLPPHQRQAAAEANEAQIQDISRIHIFLRMLIPALSRAVTLDLRHLTAIQSARVSLALERYRLATGDLPDTLDQLVPSYLDAVPIDPFDGNSLRYKLLDSGCVVYSVDEDGRDDGAKSDEWGCDEDEDPCATYDITFTLYR